MGNTNHEAPLYAVSMRYCLLPIWLMDVIVLSLR